LLDVQYQAKLLHIHQEEASTSRNNEATSAIPPQASTPQVLNELARHEMRQSKVSPNEEGTEKQTWNNLSTVRGDALGSEYVNSSNFSPYPLHFQVQQQIEKLKVSQIEKQLQLKEVATRRKIHALKQQLQVSGTVIQTSPPPNLQSTTANQSHNTGMQSLAHSHPSAALTANPHNGYVLSHTHEIVRPCISQQVSGTVQRAKAIGNPPATAPVTVKQEHPGIQSSRILKSGSDHTAGSVNGDWHMPHAQQSCGKPMSKRAQAAHIQTSITQTVSNSPDTRVAYITPQTNANASEPYYNQSTFGSLLKTHAQPPSSSSGDYKSTKPETTHARAKGTTKMMHRYSEYTDAKKIASPKVEVSAKSSVPVENTVHPHLVPVSGADIQHATSTNKVSDKQSRSQEASVTNTADHSNTSARVNQTKCGASALLRRSQTTEILQSQGTTTSEPLNTSQQDNTGTRPRLTLPEEIKETEYMTAIQRQKARVSRIRRCIAAATVIQRAWREYKYTCRPSKC